MSTQTKTETGFGAEDAWFADEGEAIEYAIATSRRGDVYTSWVFGDAWFEPRAFAGGERWWSSCG